jgi:hypothetical protein
MVLQRHACCEKSRSKLCCRLFIDMSTYVASTLLPSRHGGESMTGGDTRRLISARIRRKESRARTLIARKRQKKKKESVSAFLFFDFSFPCTHLVIFCVMTAGVLHLRLISSSSVIINHKFINKYLIWHSPHVDGRTIITTSKGAPSFLWSPIMISSPPLFSSETRTWITPSQTPIQGHKGDKQHVRSSVLLENDKVTPC